MLGLSLTRLGEIRLSRPRLLRGRDDPFRPPTGAQARLEDAARRALVLDEAGPSPDDPDAAPAPRFPG